MTAVPVPTEAQQQAKEAQIELVKRRRPPNESSSQQAATSSDTSVRKLFKEAQRTVQCHPRCCNALRRLLSKHEAVWEDYFICLARIIASGAKRHPDVDRLVQFVALAASSEGQVSEQTLGSMLTRTVDFLLEHVGAADKGVRFRCCQILSQLTTAYSQLEGIGEDNVDEIIDKLLQRLQDKEWKVREQAVLAVRPFQFALEGDDEDEAALLQEDRVRAGLMAAMMSDSQPQVRRAALGVVTKTLGAFEQLVSRTQDVDERVRVATFRTLGEDVASKHLQPHQMLTLVKRGLSDRPAVAQACRFMLCGPWFRDAGYDPIELLRRVDVMQIKNAHLQTVPEDIVREIVSLGLRAERERHDPSLGLGLTVHDAKGLRQAAGRHVEIAPAAAASSTKTPEVRVSPEEALFARIQAEVIKKDTEMSAAEKETRLEGILPATMCLCERIETMSSELTELPHDASPGGGEQEAEDVEMRIEREDFVLHQLLKLAAHADFSEEAGRRRLVALLQNLLLDLNTPHFLMGSTMTALAAAHPSDADFVRIVAELVSDVWDLVHTRQNSSGRFVTTVPGGIVQGQTTGETATSTPEISTNGSPRSPLVPALVEGDDVGAGGESATQNRRSSVVVASGVRAAIPANLVRDRARAIEGMATIDSLVEGADGRAAVADEGLDSSVGDDEFMDARSHQSYNDAARERGDDLRQVASGGVNSEVIPSEAETEAGPAEDVSNEDSDLREVTAEQAASDIHRMFRILDILTAVLTTTKQTLAKDPTLKAFDEVIMDIFAWSAQVLPTLCPDARVCGPELLHAIVVARGKHALLGDVQTTASRYGPFFLKIAADDEQWVDVRISAMQALSDLCLVFRSTTVDAIAATSTVFDDTPTADSDVLGLFARIMKDRDAHRALVAVAAEVTARFLFAELTHDPELLAHLLVLSLEKGSAADTDAASTAIATPDSTEGEDADVGGGDDGARQENDARDIGGSVRLSQILSVYFSALPHQTSRSRVLDMLANSIREVLRILVDVAELNAAAQAGIDENKDEPAALIIVPVQEVIRIAWRLLDQALSLREVAGPSVGSPAADAEKIEGNVDADEALEDQEARQSGDDEAPRTRVVTPPEGQSNDRSALFDIGAAGHAALCISEALWTLSGIDGASEMFHALAKVLKSLPLPEDQSTLKRLRQNVDRLEALGGRQLGLKASRTIAKYAEVLVALDLTPDDIVSRADTEDYDREGREESEESCEAGDDDGKEASREKAAEANLSAGSIGADVGSRVNRRKKGVENDSRTRASPRPAAHRGPMRQSKVAARKRMANAEAEAAALDAAEYDSHATSDKEDTASQASGRSAPEQGDEGDSGDSDDGYASGSTVLASPARAKRTGGRLDNASTRVAMGDLSNSPHSGRNRSRVEE